AGVVRDYEVPGYANLPGQHTVFADLCRTRYACLGSNHRISAYLDVVSNLYQVIEFNSGTDHRSVARECCTVYHRVRTNGYVVFYDHSSQLGNGLVRSILLLCEPEAIAADHRT